MGAVPYLRGLVSLAQPGDSELTIAITGASGLVGTALSALLRAAGNPVRTIGRGPANDVQWNPDANELPAGALDGVRAVVHLAGATIAERWTAARKRAIWDSRVQGTALLTRTIAAMPASLRPEVFVSSSAVGYYGSRGADWLDESSYAGSDFLADVCVAWEGAATPARDAGVRVVHLRQGVVLSPRGGAVAKMLPVFKLAAGGQVGAGDQWMSWIGLHDATRAFRFCLDTTALSGAVNAVAPNPVTNREFTDTLGRVLRRPAVARVPAFAIRALFGEMGTATLLASQRVRPLRLEQNGFAFEFPQLEDALRHELP